MPIAACSKTLKARKAERWTTSCPDLFIFEALDEKRRLWLQLDGCSTFNLIRSSKNVQPILMSLVAHHYFSHQQGDSTFAVQPSHPANTPSLEE
eukprot:1492779-Amphidinium_carterae.1